MLKTVKMITVMAAIIAAVIYGCAGAEAQEYFDEQYSASGAERLTECLPDETKDLLDDVGVSIEGFSRGEGVGFQQLVELIKVSAEGNAQHPLKTCAAIIGVTLVCAVLNGVKNTGGIFALTEQVSTVATIAGITAAITPAAEHIVSCCENICGVCDFSTVFVPVFAAAAAADGSTAAAAGCSLFALTAAECFSIMLSRIVVPLLRTLLAFAAVSAVSPYLHFDGVTALLRENIKWVLGLLAAVFTGVLGVSVKTGAALDSTGAKAARFVVANAVPVIGGAVGDALASVQSCVGILRSSVGAFGIVAMGALILPSLLRTILWMFGTGICRIFAQAMEVGSVAKLLSALHDVLSILMAVMIFTTVVLIASAAMLLSK